MKGAIGFIGVAVLCGGLSASYARAAGEHLGEADNIQAQVTFLGNAGLTTTDAAGTTYRVAAWNWSTFEPKIYPSNYWGTFPLYFIGTTMSFNVTLTNTATQGNKSFKVRVRASNNVLETSGLLGMQIAAPQEWVVDSLRPGETRVLPGSIFIAYDPNLPSGLDITKVQIFHLNEGSNQDAALIKEALAVWCPPSLKDSPPNSR